MENEVFVTCTNCHSKYHHKRLILETEIMVDIINHVWVKTTVRCPICIAREEYMSLAGTFKWSWYDALEKTWQE